MLVDRPEARFGEKLEGRQRQCLPKAQQQVVDRRQARDGQQQDLAGSERVAQSQRGLDDQPERPLAADEQMPQVVPRGVLDQTAIQLQNVPPARDDLQAGDPVARHPVADDLDAAGVGGDVAADLAGTARGEIDREHQATIGCVRLDLRGDNTGLDGDHPVDGLEIQDTVHPLARDDDFSGGGDGAAAQPRPAARGNER
jgi:hypothetical protein